MAAFIRKYATGTGADVIIPIVKAGSNDFAVSADWTPVAGDVKISKDGGAAANIATLPTFVTDVGWRFVFSDAELTAARINVNVVDSATKAIEDQHLVIETYGNASAQHAFDLDTANVTLAAVTHTGAVIPTVSTLTGHTPQTGDSFARLGAPAGASVSADIATVDGNVDAILLDTAEIGTAGAGLTAVPWNAAWDTEVESEVNDGLTAFWTSPATLVDLVWDEAQSGHVAAGSMGEMATEIASILVDTAEIGNAGAGLTAIPWNASWDAEVQSEVDDALVARDLHYLVNTALPTSWSADVTANSALDYMADDGSSTYDRNSHSLFALANISHPTAAQIADAVWDETQSSHVTAGTFGEIATEIGSILVDTAEIGTAGAGLTNVPWNVSWDAEVQSEVDDALVARSLHYLVDTALPTNWTTDVTANSALDQMADDGTATFDRTTDSLQAIADSGGGGPTAAQIADAVWDEAQGDHTTAGTFGETATEIASILVDTAEIGTAGAGLTNIPWNASWDAEVQSECDDALVARDLHFLINTALPTSWTTDVTANSALDYMADDGTATFDRTTDSLQAIADSGGGGPTAAQIADAVWDEAQGDHVAAGTFGEVATEVANILVDTAEIGTAGAGLTNIPWNASWDAEVESEVDDALIAKNLHYVAHTALPTNWATDITANSALDYMADDGTAVYDRTTDSLQAIADSGGGGPTAAQIADAVWDEAQTGHATVGTFGETLQGHVPQTGDNFARLGAPVGASISADIATVDGNVDAILVDTAEIGTAGAGLTAVPWNAAWDAEVESEVDDALVAKNLHYVAHTALPTNWSTDITANSALDYIADDGTAVYDRTTDSLQAISDSGGGGLTQQQVRDAMKLAPTGGAPTAGSVDQHLDDLETGVTVTTNSDKTGYSLVVDQAVNMTKVNGVAVTGPNDLKADVSGLSTFDAGVDTVTLAATTHTGAVIPTVSTLTGHTPQTGDSFARLGAPAGASVSADIATVDTNVDAILVDTAEIGVAGAGLTAVTAATVGDKTGYSLAATEDVYHADIELTIDQANTRDEYTATWFKNGQRVTSGVTVPTIQVIRRSDGLDLVASTAMTQIGTTGSYKHDETSNRTTAGEAVLVIVSATIDASTRTFAKVASRDST